MKIGIVLANTPGYSETFFHSKIKGLKEDGIDVFLYCQSKNNNFSLCPVFLSSKVSSNPIIQGINFLKIFLSLIPHLNAVLKFFQLEKNDGSTFVQILKKIYLNAHLLKADLDWLHFGFVTQALGSEAVAKAIGAKMAISFRGFDIAVYPLKNPSCYKKVWKYVDKVHTISNDLLLLAKKQGLPENIPVEKITPAINVQLFNSVSTDFKNEQKPVFMTTGRLHWKKGIVETIEALAILKKNGLDFTYKVVGEGIEYERIAYTAYELGLKDNLELLGKLPHSEVKSQLETASIYIQYSIQEGFCNAVLEAQAMGKLCIVSDAEGLPENVLDEITGWVVPKYSSELLAEKIHTVLAMSPSEKLKISKNAQKRVLENFNIEKQQKEFVEFYKN